MYKQLIHVKKTIDECVKTASPGKQLGEATEVKQLIDKAIEILEWNANEKY